MSNVSIEKSIDSEYSPLYVVYEGGTECLDLSTEDAFKMYEFLEEYFTQLVIAAVAASKENADVTQAS